MRAFHQYSIPALWVAWLLYWSIAAIGAKANHRVESFASRLSHTVPLALGIALLATTQVPFAWLALRFLPPSADWFWLGFILVDSASSSVSRHGSGSATTGAAW